MILEWTEHPELSLSRGVCGKAKAEIIQRDECLRVFVDIASKYATASGAARFDKDKSLDDVKKWAQDWVDAQEELLKRVE